MFCDNVSKSLSAVYGNPHISSFYFDIISSIAKISINFEINASCIVEMKLFLLFVFQQEVVQVLLQENWTRLSKKGRKP